MNYIETIFLKANQDITIEPSAKVTIIHGYSATGKTLLFKLIEFVLGKEDIIDFEEAKKHFSGLEYIEIAFSGGQKTRRNLEKPFKGYVKNPNTEELEEKSKEDYRKYVGEVFKHKDISVIRKDSTFKTTKLSVPEFINNFFFSEGKIGNADPFYKLEGRTEELKLKNYFKYFVTGMIVDDKDIKQKKEELEHAEQEKSANKFFKSFKKLVKTPSQTQINHYNAMPTEILFSENEISRLNKELFEIEKRISEGKILLDRFVSLKELYLSQKEDLKGSIGIDLFMNSSCIQCEKCGNKIIWERENSLEEEIEQLNFKINELKSVEFKKQKEISDVTKLRSDIRELIIKEETKLKKLQIEKEELEPILQDYLSYQNAYKIFFRKGEEEKKEKIEININEKIEKEFRKQISNLCKNISNRLKTWKIPKHTEVSFNYEKFEFTYDNTPRNILAKGFKSFCTTAMIIELVNQMKAVGVSCFDFILIDTIWQIGDFEDIDILEVAKNYINDVANLDIQTIIFENKVPKRDSIDCKIISLNEAKDHGADKELN